MLLFIPLLVFHWVETMLPDPMLELLAMGIKLPRQWSGRVKSATGLGNTAAVPLNTSLQPWLVVAVTVQE